MSLTFQEVWPRVRAVIQEDEIFRTSQVVGRLLSEPDHSRLPGQRKDIFLAVDRALNHARSHEVNGEQIDRVGSFSWTLRTVAERASTVQPVDAVGS